MSERACNSASLSSGFDASKAYIALINAALAESKLASAVATAADYARSALFKIWYASSLSSELSACSKASLAVYKAATAVSYVL